MTWPELTRVSWFSPFQSAQNLPRQEFQNLKKSKNQKEKEENFQKKKSPERILIVRNPGKISICDLYDLLNILDTYFRVIHLKQAIQQNMKVNQNQNCLNQSNYKMEPTNQKQIKSELQLKGHMFNDL